jgi:hypothetical protein
LGLISAFLLANMIRITRLICNLFLGLELVLGDQKEMNFFIIKKKYVIYDNLTVESNMIRAFD